MPIKERWGIRTSSTDAYDRRPSVYSTTTADGKNHTVLDALSLGARNDVVRKIAYLARRPRVNETYPRQVMLSTPLCQEIVATRLNGHTQHLCVYYRDNQAHDMLVILHVGRHTETDRSLAQQRLEEDEQKTHRLLMLLKDDPQQRTARFFNRLVDAVSARARGAPRASLPVAQELQLLYAAFDLPFAHCQLRAQAEEITQTALDTRKLESSAQERAAQEQLDGLLAPFDMQIRLGRTEEFEGEERADLLGHLERDLGRSQRRALRYFTYPEGTTVLERSKERIPSRHLPPLRKRLQDYARGTLDVSPVESGYPGIKRLSVRIESVDYAAFVLIDEANTVVVLELAVSLPDSCLQESFKQAVANKIAHQKALRLQLQHLQERAARNQYLAQVLNQLPLTLSEAIDEILGMLFKIQAAREACLAHEELQGIAGELARLCRDKKTSGNALALAHWLAAKLDTDLRVWSGCTDPS